MKLELREITEQRVRIKRDLPPAILGLDGLSQYRVVDAVSLDLQVSKDGSKYWLGGQIDALLKIECGRCLDMFEFKVKIDIDLLYLPLSDDKEDSDVLVEESDLRAAYYQDEQIDLAQLVMEQFQLAMPMKPLCRDGCQGLCVMCGGNKNFESCQCVESWEDPRLSGLKSLLEQ